MKKTTSLATLLLLLLFLITNCSKSDITDEGISKDSRLRITKMAHNKYLDNPSTFEYNTDNLIVKINLNYGENKKIVEIQYNSDNKPINVNLKEYYSNELRYDNTIEIQWTNNGFTLNYEDGEQDDIQLDSQRRVIKTNSNDEFTWYGNDSLIVKDMQYDDVEKYRFNEYKHPLSGLNIAVILAAEINLGEWEVEWQNNYCLREYDDGSWIIRNEYTVNEQGYPTLMETRYLNTEENLPNEYMSFEYESY